MKQIDQRNRLAERLSELRARLSAIRFDVTRPHSNDSAEQAQERENDQVLDTIGNETRRAIEVVEAALERIDNGSYGTCEACGAPIDGARLEVIPEATRCVRCIG